MTSEQVLKFAELRLVTAWLLANFGPMCPGRATPLVDYELEEGSSTNTFIPKYVEKHWFFKSQNVGPLGTCVD